MAHEHKTEVHKPFVGMTILFAIILCLVPFVMDFFAKLFLALGGNYGFITANPWIGDVLGYGAVFLLMLFYLKTTFEPLSSYGYKWNSDHIWWAVYLGIGSGVIIYLVDRLHGLASLGVAPFSGMTFIGYLLAWVLLPAFTEETLFRGVIQTFYQSRFVKTITTHKIHVAVFFAVAAELLFHIIVPLYYGVTHGGLAVAFINVLPQLLYVAIFGFISSVFYQRTGSLAGPIIIHALGNLTELMLIWSIH